MNVRLSRFALIAVLLLSTLVVLQLSGSTAAPNSQAQGISCVDEQATQTAAAATQTAALPTPTATATVAPDPGTVPWATFRSQSVDVDENDEIAETLILVVSIQSGVTFAPGSMTGDSIIQIDSGTVNVEACSNVDLAVRPAGSNELIVLAPGSDADLDPGSTIFVPQGGSYRITTEDSQASFTLIGTGTFIQRGLCGGAGC